MIARILAAFRLLLHGQDDAHRIDFEARALRITCTPDAQGRVLTYLFDPRRVNLSEPDAQGNQTLTVLPDPEFAQLMDRWTW